MKPPRKLNLSEYEEQVLRKMLGYAVMDPALWKPTAAESAAIFRIYRRIPQHDNTGAVKAKW